MKSNSIRGVAGNVKCRGKLSKTLSCGCCDVFNFKSKARTQEADKEAREYRVRGRAWAP